jgi:hypothetical protein
MIESLGNAFIDLRETISGNSYTWFGLHKPEQIKTVTIHHTVTSRTTTPEQIAQIHLKRWGKNAGIGYHFLIGNEEVNGLAKVYYVGDLNSYRAHVFNKNIGNIGVSLIGNFEKGHDGYNGEPSNAQLQSTHLLVEWLKSKYPIQNVLRHKDQQATACPGNTSDNWFNKIIQGVLMSVVADRLVVKDSKSSKCYGLKGGRIHLYKTGEEYTAENKWEWLRELTPKALNELLKINNIGNQILIKGDKTAPVYYLDTKNNKFVQFTENGFLKDYEWSWIVTVPENTLKTLMESFSILKTVTTLEKSLADKEKEVFVKNAQIKALEDKNKELITKCDLIVKTQALKEKEFNDLVRERDNLKREFELIQSENKNIKNSYETEISKLENLLREATYNWQKDIDQKDSTIKDLEYQHKLIIELKDREIEELRKGELGKISIGDLIKRILKLKI